LSSCAWPTVEAEGYFLSRIPKFHPLRLRLAALRFCAGSLETIAGWSSQRQGELAGQAGASPMWRQSITAAFSMFAGSHAVRSVGQLAFAASRNQE
jgi:hypothetical protein